MAVYLGPVARSADAAATVLNSLRLLHDVGGDMSLEPGELIEAFEQIGIAGFTLGQEPYFLMAATMLRLLLRHASIGPDEMFDATVADLAELGRDIDEAKFREIAERLSDSDQ
jgi:hypothetical protein